MDKKPDVPPVQTIKFKQITYGESRTYIPGSGNIQHYALFGLTDGGEVLEYSFEDCKWYSLPMLCGVKV